MVAARRDSAGYLTTSAERLSTPTAALTSEGFSIQIDGNGWLDKHLGTVRITATSSAAKPVFVGIGAEPAVRSWLAGVASDRVHDLEVDPFSVDYARQPGSVKALSAPAGRTFWAARSTGSTTQTLTWPIRDGRWTIVVANADGSPGVAVDARLGAKLPWLGPLGVGLIVAGVVMVLAGTAGILIAFAGRRRRSPSPRMA